MKALYLAVHEPGLAAPVDAAKQMIFDQGRDVGIEARKRYPGGILIDLDHRHGREALQATREAMEHNPPAIFEAAFLHDDTLVRIDVLKANGDGSWDLIEVKSTSRLKDEHIPDMAIQRYVAEGAGLRIRRVWLKHVNSECVHPDWSNLFEDVDCTDEVEAQLPAVPERVRAMLAALAAPSAPDTSIGVHCDKPYECAFKGDCWKSVPEHSVLELGHVWGKDKFKLYDFGIQLIKEIPDGMKVSRMKPRQVQAVKTGKPVADKAGVKAFLDRKQYPLFFFDFETWNPALPRHDGMRPYQHIAFQFSCHFIEKPGAPLRHREFLGDGATDPRREIVDKLLDVLGKTGTIFAFNDDFEKTTLKDLAAYDTAKSDRLRDLLPRFLDLHEPFAQHYYHPDFHGSLSIKDVLPVIVPSMTYVGMEVPDGHAAQAAYQKLGDPKTDSNERGKIREALLAYCKQDTLAMVKIFEWLVAFAT